MKFTRNTRFFLIVWLACVLTLCTNLAPSHAKTDRWTKYQVENAICATFHPCAYPIRIAYCESNPDHLFWWPRYATGSAGERGVFQIHPVWSKVPWVVWSKMYNLIDNIKVAFRISGKGTNFRQWSCRYA